MANKHAAALGRLRQRLAPREPKRCPVCEQVKPMKLDQTYCSPKCRTRGNWTKHRERYVEERKRRRRAGAGETGGSDG
jgi:hypothetical protein